MAQACNYWGINRVGMEVKVVTRERLVFFFSVFGLCAFANMYSACSTISLRGLYIFVFRVTSNPTVGKRKKQLNFLTVF